MIPYTESMTQCATYWAPGGNDGFGGRRAVQPQHLACRWQNVAQLFRTPEGREQVSQAVVYVSAAVALGGRLLLGEDRSLPPPAKALEIRQVDSSPSLDGSEVLHKAYL